MTLSFLPNFFQRIKTPLRKIALLRASRIGDFICAIPAFRSLRMALPNTEIVLITLPILQPLAKRLPYIDRSVAFPGYPGIAEQLFLAHKALAFFSSMQQEYFDLAVQLQGSGVYSNPFLLMLGATHNVGFVRKNDSIGRLDAAIPLPEQGHEIYRTLALPYFLGCPHVSEHIEIALDEDDEQAATSLLGHYRQPLIGIHTNARDKTRRWPLNSFIEAATALQEALSGTIVILGESEEGEISFAKYMHAEGLCINLCGKTSLTETCAVLKRLSLFITNDTGPAHLAYAMNTPTVTIFGGGDPARYGPLHPGPFRVLIHPVSCRPCYEEPCDLDFQCLRSVSVHEVIAAGLDLLK